MTVLPVFLVTHDAGLLDHWLRALDGAVAGVFDQYAALEAATLPPGAALWLDSALPDLPDWQDARWQPLVSASRLVLASSRPDRTEAMRAFEAGCVGYCHAFADRETLQQVQEVVAAGNVWVGRELMQQLLAAASHAAARRPAADAGWSAGLTEREREVSELAANGVSNRDIALRCRITERTVKAHLAAVFHKLNVTDRLQLALRVHGIS